MKLKALDQVSISAVQADSLRKGQEFEVSDAYGAELLEKLPGVVAKVDPVAASLGKAAATTSNKAARRAANK